MKIAKSNRLKLMEAETESMIPEVITNTRWKVEVILTTIHTTGRCSQNKGMTVALELFQKIKTGEDMTTLRSTTQT